MEDKTLIAKNDVKWNNKLQNDGALYFFQRIVEMLSFNTRDLYLCPIMNTHRLIKEYIVVSKGNFKANHLDEIYDEFLLSFKSDVAIRHGLGETKINEIAQKLNSKKNNRNQLMDYLLQTIGSNYLSWIKNYILEIVPEGKQKSKIEKAIRCFLPELLLCGYSSHEIYYRAKSIINSRTYTTSILKSFLNRFDRKEKQFTAYLAIKKDLANFKDILSDRVGVIFNDDGNFHRFEPWDDYTVVKLQDIDALDAGGAADMAYKQLSFFASFYQFVGDYSSNLIQSTALIWDNKSEFRIENINSKRFKIIHDEDQTASGRISESIITSLVSHARCSLATITKLLKLHNNAISNNGQENGFLNLWSILEVICIRDNTSKLMQVKETLIPFLQYDYLVNIFTDITENLKLVLSEQDFATLCAKVDKETEEETIKIACLILLDEYSNESEALIEKLANYPVLRFRIMDLHNNYKTKKELFNLSNRYAKRVNWHISRIYRARNSIAHDGTPPVILNELGVHLHAYVDSLMTEILIKLSTSSYCHISNVLIDSNFKHDNIQNSLQTNDKFDFESINLMLNEGEYYCPISID